MSTDGTTIIKHPEYDFFAPQWQLVEDACDGQHKIKAGKEKYLPKPNPDDRSPENQKRYEQYLLRALFYNVCFRTLSGMVGVAFRKEPQKEIPAAVEYLDDNVNGAALSIDQQAQWALSEVIKKGRVGLFVDYPIMQGETSRADVERGIRATIKGYQAGSVVDWNEEETPTGMRLNYVKIQEVNQVIDILTGDRETVTSYIILRLIDGVYSVQRTDDESMTTGEILEPRKADGSTFDFIPFIFVGSENNSPDIDQSLLYDLASVNIAHYRNSADNEESSYLTGQGTLAVTSSLSANDWKEQNPNGIMIGSRKGHFLGESGDLKLVQADPNTLPIKNMEIKEAQMVSLGAQLVSPQSNETAFTTGVNLATNTSALALAVGNVSNAYEQCMEWAQLYMQTGQPDDAVYRINTEFFPANVDAQTLTAWVSGIQGGVLPQSALNGLLREAGITALTDEEIQAEMENSGDGIDLGAE